MVQMSAVRVTTARKLMHEKPEGRSNRHERGPHRSREQVRILKEVGTLKAALISVGKPGQASAASMQCLAEFGIYHYLQMTPQEAHHVTLCPQWKIVLNTVIESRRNELQCKAIKQDRWNNRETDRQAEKAFLEEHKGPFISAELFAQKEIGAFRFSAALIEWSQSELESLQKIWVQAYKNAWHVPWSSANSLLTFPTAEGGHECPLPSGVLTQALLQHVDQGMRHEDVVKKIC